MTTQEPTDGVLLAARGLAASYGPREVFREACLELRAGRLVALIGPNGSGKTTLLHALCGLLRPTAGQIELLGRPIAELSRREIARRVALVAQSSAVDVEITVEETVTLGRYPRVGPWAPLSADDRQTVETVLAAMDLLPLRGRPLQTLSGGERQRVLLARALAQETPVLLLDEPVTSLDLRYQQETYERLAALVGGAGGPGDPGGPGGAGVRGDPGGPGGPGSPGIRGATGRERRGVLVADHHLNLVAATCDAVLVLHEGRLRAAGPPREVITEETIRGVFGARMRVRHDEQGRPQCLWDF
jgi:iron complex transport system ATP-binding protein